ncbi:MAG: hypothetical protein ACI9GZ_003047, partial [Bacteroidia bacterium]
MILIDTEKNTMKKIMKITQKDLAIWSAIVIAVAFLLLF